MVFNGLPLMLPQRIICEWPDICCDNIATIEQDLCRRNIQPGCALFMVDSIPPKMIDCALSTIVLSFVNSICFRRHLFNPAWKRNKQTYFCLYMPNIIKKIISLHNHSKVH